MVQYGMKPVRVEISYKTIVFTVIFLISLLVIWELRAILLTFFVCFIFMEALNPTITKLEKFKIPRALAILLIYTILIAIISFAIAGIVPVIAEQSTGLIKTLPQTISNIKLFGYTAADFNNQFKILETIPSEIAQLTFSLFSNIFSALIVLVITFYLLMERKNIHHYSLPFFGKTGNDKFIEVIQNLETRLGSWIIAELILMTVVGLLCYFGFLIIGLPYAAPLAVIAGILEIIPNIGPTASAAIAVLVGLSVSPITAILALVVGIIVQQLENNLIVPKVMRETVGLNPLVTILVITSGARLAGIIGAILAIPIFITGQVIFKTLYPLSIPSRK